MSDRLSEYMSDRMPNTKLEFMSNRISVGGDHSKKVIYRCLVRKTWNWARCWARSNNMPSVPQPTWALILTIFTITQTVCPHWRVLTVAVKDDPWSDGSDIFPVNFRKKNPQSVPLVFVANSYAKWLLWHVQVYVDFAGPHKDAQSVRLGSGTFPLNFRAQWLF